MFVKQTLLNCKYLILYLTASINCLFTRPEVRLLNIDVSEKTEEQQAQPTPMPAPQFKIMRRSAGSGSISPRSASSAGEDQSKNNAIDRKNMTLEERKTAYEEARARIFQGLEENKQQPE